MEAFTGVRTVVHVSIDRNKVLEAAQKHLAKGNLDKAIVEFQRLVAADPKDVRTLLKIGELQARKGSIRDACDTYLKVGDSYSDQGFFSKSVAVYKQVVKLDPTRVDAIKKLARNYEDLQLTGDALAAYELLAQTLAQKGDMDGALAAMSHATSLDPQNLAARIRYAEALSKAGKTKEAADEFETSARQIKQQGRIDDYIKVAERLLFHRDNDLALAKELAGLYLERNDGKRALAKLQVLFKANPKDDSVLTMLAQAFVSLEQRDKAIQVLKELARHHLEQHRTEDRVRVLRRILELDPTDAEAKQALLGDAPAHKPKVDIDAIVPNTAVVGGAGSSPAARPGLHVSAGQGPSVPMPGQARGPAPAVPRPATGGTSVEPPAATIIRVSRSSRPPAASHAVRPVEVPKPAPLPAVEDEIIIIDDEAEVSAEPAEPVQRASQPGAEVSTQTVVARLLAECDVFGRYGLKDKIVDQLERVVALAPEHREARERLRDAYLDLGNVDDAVEQMVVLARLTMTSEPAYAIASLRKAVAIDPENPDVRHMLRQLDPAFSTSTASVEAVRPQAPAPLPPSREVPTQPSVLPPAPEPEPEEDVVFFDESAGASIAPPPSPAEDVLFVEEISAPASLPAEPPIVMQEPEPWRPSEPAPIAAAPAPRMPTPPPSPEPLRASPSAGMPLPAVLDFFDDEEEEPPPRMSAAEIIAEAASLAGASIATSAEMPPEPQLPDVAAFIDLDEPISKEEFEGGPASIAPPPAAPAAPAALDEVLEEVDFYLAQQLWDDARSTLSEALAAHPGHPLLTDKLEEIDELATMYGNAAVAHEAHRAEAAPPPPQLAVRPVSAPPERPVSVPPRPVSVPPQTRASVGPPAPSDDVSFALAEKLAEAIEEELGPSKPTAAGSDSVDVDQVFAQFKAGVEKQVDESDVETHYDLGIAYKEMGLLEDAVGEFEIAARSETKASIALTMIGLCRVEQGRIDDGISALERALAAKHRDAREVNGVHYELANALALAGRNTEAIAYYEKVLAADPTFRGIREKIAALRSAAPADDAEQDELEKAFEDLLGH